MCDHSKDKDVEKLFKQIAQEQDGQLDILVNNAYDTSYIFHVRLRIQYSYEVGYTSVMASITTSLHHSIQIFCVHD